VYVCERERERETEREKRRERESGERERERKRERKIGERESEREKWVMLRGGGLGSRPKKMYWEYLGDGVEYHLMSPTPRR